MQMTQPEPLNQEVVNERIQDAARGISGIRPVSGVVHNTASNTDYVQTVLNEIDIWTAILRPLKTFNSVAGRIGEIHPYLKGAVTILTGASQIIIDQADRDAAVYSLLEKISEVYALMTEEKELQNISSMLPIYLKIAQQTQECANFIVHYSETKNFWKRLRKHVINETDSSIQSYNQVLDNLMQQFRDKVARDTVIFIHRAAEDLALSNLEYATGAGLNTSKLCLEDTREGILTEIKSWINNTGEDVPPVFWLSGTAGKGKSAIAHTIANWFHESGRLGACFCFDRTANRRHEMIVTTIACDLADDNLFLRREIAHVIQNDNELRHTQDIIRQWQKLIVEPIDKTSPTVTQPILIVIDALDESGAARSREQILQLLAGTSGTSSSQLTKFPSYFRILVTSRLLRDIHDTLHGLPHVLHVSMDDISSAAAEHDIQLYLSNKLAGVSADLKATDINMLAQKSDGLFEWARLASAHIKNTTIVGDPIRRLRSLVSTTFGRGVHLLDDMYKRILEEIIPEEEEEEAIPMFRSVMGQIIASSEPLPMAAFNAMRLHFPSEDDRYQVEAVMGPLGSLIIGTADPDIPIRPLHSSFYDFLTERRRSGRFSIDVSSVQRDLAIASLRIMALGLHFNICSLESSYFANYAVPDLETRVKDFIPVELSYSCRFWGVHVKATSFEPLLAREIEAFFDGERFLFWLEALTLVRALNSTARSLSSVADWFMDNAEYIHNSDDVRDALHFIQTFGTTILHSTPHLYLSALPFAPMQSTIFRKFAAKFPHTPRVVAGHVAQWSPSENRHHGHAGVMSVAISPDRKRIVCGSFDGTIQVWDMETGKALGAPLRGHSDAVRCIAISSNGKLIVSGSNDHTIRMWDLETGQALGHPLRGHITYVLSVSISPDGQHIVSSGDRTILVWDAQTGRLLFAPLVGHTDVVRSVAISPNGIHIVSGSDDKTIRVWNLETGEALGPLREHTDAILFLTISPDGKRIVFGSNDKIIQVLDAMTGDAIGAPLQGHTHRVWSVAISADGNLIASGSSDKTVRVWDVENGNAFGDPLEGHTEAVYSVAFSLDGKRIVSGSFDKTIRVWDLDFVNRHQRLISGRPTICFSSNPTHALCSAFSFLQDSPVPASFRPNEDSDGWVEGPEGRLLLCIPVDFHPSQSVYTPGDTLVIPSHTLQLDLSHFAHGTLWSNCYSEAAR